MRNATLFTVMVLSLMASKSPAAERPVSVVLSRSMRNVINTPLPAAWAGLWSSVDVGKDCASGSVLYTEERCDSLFAAEPIESEPDPLVCTATATDTEIHIRCSGTTAGPVCPAFVNVTFDIVRSGDTASGTMVASYDYAPECAVSDMCVRIATIQHRVASCPSTAVVPVTWGQLKQIYR